MKKTRNGLSSYIQLFVETFNHCIVISLIGSQNVFKQWVNKIRTYNVTDDEIVYALHVTSHRQLYLNTACRNMIMYLLCGHISNGLIDMISTVAVILLFRPILARFRDKLKWRQLAYIYFKDYYTWFSIITKAFMD